MFLKTMFGGIIEIEAREQIILKITYKILVRKNTKELENTSQIFKIQLYFAN